MLDYQSERLNSGSYLQSSWYKLPGDCKKRVYKSDKKVKL